MFSWFAFAVLPSLVTHIVLLVAVVAFCGKDVEACWYSRGCMGLH